MTLYVGKCFAKMYLHSLGFKNIKNIINLNITNIYFLLPEEPAILSNLYFCYAGDFKVARRFLCKTAGVQTFA